MLKNMMRPPANKRRLVVMLLLAIFVVSGLVGVNISRAATYVSQVEAEAGMKAGNATAGPSEGASGNASVKFGSAAGCVLPKYPDASCTGVPAGTQLTTYTPTGNITIDTPNTVIEGKEINGCVGVLAPGVVIKRSRINCTGVRTAVLISDVRTQDGAVRLSSVTLEDTEVNCNAEATGVEGHDVTLRRSLVQGCTFAVRGQDNLVVEDSFIRQLRRPANATTPVATGVHTPTSTARNARIQHNTIDATDGSSGINVSTQKTGSQVSITSNHIINGVWSINCPFNSSVNPVGSVRIVGNRFTSAAPKSDILFNCADEIEVRDNAYFANGNPIP